MFTIRNWGGIALFLAGTTWLWLTPAFAGREVATSGSAWVITQVLSLLTVAAFSVATYGLFSRRVWWEPVALASTALGAVALVPYWVAASNGGQAAGTTAWTTFVHVMMIGGVLVLLLVPRFERWVNRKVMAA